MQPEEVGTSSDTCIHIGLPELVCIPMGDDAPEFDLLEEVAERYEPFSWVWLGRCPVCGQHWLVAQEERINDVWVIRRLKDDEVDSILSRRVWPSDFDRYEAVLRITQQVQRFVFFDPNDSLHYMAMLARERPGITVDELGDLLNLHHGAVVPLASHLIETQGVNIDLLGRALGPVSHGSVAPSEPLQLTEEQTKFLAERGLVFDFAHMTEGDFLRLEEGLADVLVLEGLDEHYDDNAVGRRVREIMDLLD